MIKVTFIEPDKTRREVEGKTGQSLMELAVRNSVVGIDADCGGACACATCHVYVDPEWRQKTGAPAEMEESMLDFAQDIQENSRLSCQIMLTDAHDGLVVTVPEYLG